jgi:hypothetical protein
MSHQCRHDRLINDHREELGISEYSVSEATLEQIFIRFARQQEEEVAAPDDDNHHARDGVIEVKSVGGINGNPGHGCGAVNSPSHGIINSGVGGPVGSVSVPMGNFETSLTPSHTRLNIASVASPRSVLAWPPNT